MEGTKRQESARKRDLARQQKDPEGDELEVEMEVGQRDHGVPPQYTVGGGGPRQGASVGDEVDEEEVHGERTQASGADVAPTQKAQERERVRHELEREKGRAPAGHDGQLKDHRSENVTRADLDEAGREADERVAGHALPHKDH